MKINKDLVDVILMVSTISIGLIGLSDFSNELVKFVLMGACGALIASMITLRIIKARQDRKLSEKLDDIEYWM